MTQPQQFPKYTNTWLESRIYAHTHTHTHTYVCVYMSFFFLSLGCPVIEADINCWVIFLFGCLISLSGWMFSVSISIWYKDLNTLSLLCLCICLHNPWQKHLGHLPQPISPHTFQTWVTFSFYTEYMTRWTNHSTAHWEEFLSSVFFKAIP